MNEHNISAIQDTIDDIMADYIFDVVDESAIDDIIKTIAMHMNVEDNYDYLLEASIGENDVVFDLCVKPLADEEFTYFTASYTNINVEDKIKKSTIYDDYDRAMKSVVR